MIGHSLAWWTKHQLIVCWKGHFLALSFTVEFCKRCSFVFQSKKQWVLTINISSKEICFGLHIKRIQSLNYTNLDHMLFKYTHRQFWLVQAGIVWTTPIGNSVRVKTRTNPQMAIKCLGALSIRPNIPVWNSGYSMWQMEHYFLVHWTNPSRVIRFQVLHKNSKSNGRLFYLCLLALGLLNDTEVEINDVLHRWGWQYNFYHKNLKVVRNYIKSMIPLHFSDKCESDVSHFTKHAMMYFCTTH